MISSTWRYWEWGARHGSRQKSINQLRNVGQQLGPVWLAAGSSGSCAEITVHLYVFHCSSKPFFSLLSSPLTDAVAAAGARNSSSAGSGSRSLLSAAQRPTPCYSAGAGAGRSPAKRFLKILAYTSNLIIYAWFGKAYYILASSKHWYQMLFYS